MPINKTNKKKDGKQGYRVRVNYTDANGKSHQIERTAYGANEARILEMQLINDFKSQSVVPGNMTVNALYDEYIKSKTREVRESTLNKTKQILKIHILPHLKNVSLDKLTKAKLQDWKTTISEKGLSTVTMQNIYGELRSMLNFAVQMEYIPQNPLTTLGNFKNVYFEMPEEKIQFYTPKEFKKFIAVAKESAVTITDWGYYVFFSIAYYTGMRKGEINALKWTDLDGDILHVRRSVAQKIKGKDLVETPPKNRTSFRDVQAPAPLMEILKEHKLRQSQADNFSESFRICGGISCLRDTSIENKNKKFAEAAGLHHIRIHDFRHSHASLLANEGINIQEIAKRLGHSNIEMTWNTYSHLYPRENERAIKILNKIK